MNCAPVTIEQGNSASPTPPIPFKYRPPLFVINMNNSCWSIQNTELIFPNPGPDVTTNHKVTKNQPNINVTWSACESINEYPGSVLTPIGYSNSSALAKDSSIETPQITTWKNQLITPTKLPQISTATSPSTSMASSEATSNVSSAQPSVAASGYSDPSSASQPNNPTSASPASSKASSSVPENTYQSTLVSLVTVTTEYITTIYPSPTSQAGKVDSGNSIVSGKIAPATTASPNDYATADSQLKTSGASSGSEDAPATTTAPSSPSDTPQTSTKDQGNNAAPVNPNSPSTPGGITKDGACGPSASGATCKGSTDHGWCCSKYGQCGITDAHCGDGCLADYGVCGEQGKTQSPAGLVKKMKMTRIKIKRRGKYWSA